MRLPIVLYNRPLQSSGVRVPFDMRLSIVLYNGHLFFFCFVGNNGEPGKGYNGHPYYTEIWIRLYFLCAKTKKKKNHILNSPKVDGNV